MIKAVFWDNDGVLVDTERHYFETTRDTLAAIDVELTADAYVELFMTQSTGAWHLAAAAGLDPDAIERLRVTRDERYCERLRAEPLVIPGIVDTLDRLSGRYRMGIVTSAYPEHFDLVHARTGLLPYFDFVLTGRDFTRFKPDPEPYLLAVERSGYAPDECVAIEDSARGLASATAAGIRCIVIPGTMTRRCAFAGAFATLERAADLIEVLEP